MTRILTAIMLLAATGFAIAEFFFSVQLADFTQFPLQISDESLIFLLLILICLLMAIEFLEEPIWISRLDGVIKVQADRLQGKQALQRVSWLNVVQTFGYWAIAGLIVLVDIAIVISDLFGGLEKTLSQPVGLALRVVLVVVLTTFAAVVLRRSSRFAGLVGRIKTNNEAIEDIREKREILVLDRATFHRYLLEHFDEHVHSDTVFVSNFEEPYEEFKPPGYYYEKPFMRSWFTVMKEKAFNVNQLIMVNSERDLHDLETRLEVTKDIPNYNLGCIIAPPLTVFIDMYILAGKFALIATSPDPRTPNLNVQAIIIRDKGVVALLEEVFKNILVPRAIHVKTREGVHEEKVAFIREEIKRIIQSRDSRLRNLFKDDYRKGGDPDLGQQKGVE